ncbi:ATP-dependent helicase [Nonomuraea sp. NPDC049158]|uniref:ATP-dependent helicase n=1 Tax=Nonomuraea sp. NPDC049158 TaxID=3155649 RepID=UPI003404168E
MRRRDSALANELAALNEEQRQAVLHVGDLAVLAGPGSGKTRTLVAKVGCLLSTQQISPWRSVAAITYTRSAAREVTNRLRSLGITPGRRLVSSTSHSWCLGSILRPYGPLVGVAAPGPASIVDEKSDEWTSRLKACLDAEGVWASSTDVVKARRILAAGENLEDLAYLSQVAKRFDEQLLEAELFDHDLIVSQSLRILQKNPNISRMIGARFPWMTVDEYQDLGPVLHALVLHLHDKEGVRVAAFGDPDQTVMSFAGASPRYLWELAARQGFHEVFLGINYRCGQAIIAASHLALNEQRDQCADPAREDLGVVEPVSIAGGLEDHAHAVLKKISEISSAGWPLHSVAILYPSRGPLLDALTEALDAGNVPYVFEAEQRLPKGDLADFIKDCAARAIVGPQPSSWVDGERHIDQVNTITDLAHTYNRLRQASGLPKLLTHSAGGQLAAVLRVGSAEELLAPWVASLDEALGLEEIGARSPIQRDQFALRGFQDAAREHRLTLGDVAGSVRRGKVTLTTYHSAKSREWDFVLLPGLVDGIMPYRRWSRQRRQFLEPTPDALAQARRAFYVALTRAKIAVVLYYGRYWETGWGARNAHGVSRFVLEMLRRMGSAETT